mmetsp:Transcript_57038/g.51315  ORF Transcript_57038/g.51315 Transcript_57038/m.51315 type:complete len:405 (+) Transcript_57038:32-1246(+)|eukprot:CAMPEP_0201563870 /NCGR_PEP_ID=MMETSP0190_2-20130828/1410_1 /ASSEMBLY_ACC=CAM_ASM_000263 /TAXON_ID=37353 /ORGANISM="Rosalina sp." /LENGTH=404 /DNA_ID=CAMNT_0047979243 /DNA_START=32 /DNA_END=1246 /DNA_ORIENTATION=+
MAEAAKEEKKEEKAKVGDDIDLSKIKVAELHETLKKNEYPAKEIGDEKCTSLMGKYATKELFEEYKDKKTGNGFTFAQCINTGVKNQRSLMGCHAGDIESYTLYGKFFDSVINDYHNFDVTKKKHPTGDVMDAAKLKNKLTQDSCKRILSTRIRVARNLTGHALAPGQKSIEEKKKIEEVFKKVFEFINKSDDEKYADFKGQYYGLYEISEEQRQGFIADHFLFKGNDKMQADSGYHNWFPQARGIYFNHKKTFLCWINEGDHLRIISMEKDDKGDVVSVFNRLSKAQQYIQEIMVSQKFCEGGFMKNDTLGHITCCPTNLGTGLRGGVHIKLEKLAKKSMDDLNEVAIKFHCQIRGIHGEHSESEGGILDISNKYRLGYSENELVDFMIAGVNEFVKMENEEK